MFYKLLGIVVWRIGKRVLRRKYGAARLAEPLLAGGLVAVLVAVAFVWRRAAQRRLSHSVARPHHCGNTARPRRRGSGTIRRAWSRHGPRPPSRASSSRPSNGCPSGAEAGLVRVRGRWAEAARRRGRRCPRSACARR